jgi:hypothetical protein
MDTVSTDAALWRSCRAQGLLEPVDVVEDAVLRCAGVFGAAPTAHLSLAARTKDFSPSALDDALLARRTLIRVPAMRGSVYLLPPELVPHGLVLAGKVSALPALHQAGVTDAAYGGVANAIETLLRDGPLTASEIKDRLTTWRERVPGTLSLLLRQMSHDGRVVRTRVRGGWRSQQFEYALLRDWIPMPAKQPTEVQALQRLAPLYFAAHGPATAADFGWWAGVSELAAKSALERLGLESVFLNKVRGIYLAPREVLDELPSAPRRWSSLALLPFWDAYVMAHADRARYLDAKDADRVVDGGGNVTNTILRDGRVAGVWDYQEGRLTYAPFTPFRMQSIRDAAAPHAKLLEVREVVESAMRKPLSARGQNAFQSPLA